MKPILLFVLLLLIRISPANADINYEDVRSFSAGSSFIAARNEFAVPKNISLFNSKKIVFTAGVENRYFIKELSPAIFHAIIPISNSTAIAAGIQRLGNKSYSENAFDLGIAKKLGSKFNAGIQFHYNASGFTDAHYSTLKNINPEFFISSVPLKSISFGAIVRIPVRIRMTAKDSGEKAEINSGFEIRVSDKSVLAFSVAQQNELPLSIHAGMEYNIVSGIYLRCGCQTQPLRESFGLGYIFNNWSLDAGYRTESVPGSSAAVSISFRL
jgi:hypothetical protein